MEIVIRVKAVFANNVLRNLKVLLSESPLSKNNESNRRVTADTYEAGMFDEIYVRLSQLGYDDMLAGMDLMKRAIQLNLPR